MKNNLDLVKAIYPNFRRYEANYNPLIESFGTVLLQVDDDSYQGDSRVLLRRGDEYGILIFGWGSCTGCDALQGCNSYEDLEELRASLEADIKWMSARRLLSYIRKHDWAGDFSAINPLTKQFVQDAEGIMELIANAQ